MQKLFYPNADFILSSSPSQNLEKRDEDLLKNEDILKEKRTLLLPSILLPATNITPSNNTPRPASFLPHPLNPPIFNTSRGKESTLKKKRRRGHLNQLLPHRSLCAATPHSASSPHIPFALKSPAITVFSEFSRVRRSAKGRR